MTELIKVSKDEKGNSAVSARELHSVLESKQEFASWIKNRIEKYGFIENEDYARFDKVIKTTGGRTIEYALTISAAKELAMVEGNDKGKQVRKYFIECEKELKAASKPMSTLEMMRYSLTLLEEQERRNAEIDKRMLNLEARSNTSESGFYTVMGYGTLIGRRVTITEAAIIGKKAAAMSRGIGVQIGTTKDERFGKVNIYHEDVLAEAFMKD